METFQHLVKIALGPLMAGIGFEALLECSPRFVELINADSLSREALQLLLDDNVVISRFEVSGAVGKRLERASAHVRSLGGNVLLTTHHSAVMGVIFKDVRYTGPPDGYEVMYALRRR